MGKFLTHYTDEELKAIKEQWLKDKKRIDEKLEMLILRSVLMKKDWLAKCTGGF